MFMLLRRTRRVPFPILQPFRRQKHSVIEHPLLAVLLPPPSLPSPSSYHPTKGQAPTTWPATVKYRPVVGEEAIVDDTLCMLADDLREVHLRKVSWPVHQVADIQRSTYIRDVFCQPVASLLNQLVSKRIKATIRCESLSLGDAITFAAEDFEEAGICAPVVITFSQLFQDGEHLCTDVISAVEQIRKVNKKETFTIATNFSDIIVFHPRRRSTPVDIVAYEQVFTEKPLVSLRVLIAAFLHLTLLLERSIYVPDWADHRVDRTMILPAGPPIDPNQAILSDDTIFPSCGKHSDFDFTTLVRDRERALQFFRWKLYIAQTHSRKLVIMGDTLTCSTNGLERAVQPWMPLYGFDRSDLPSETKIHLQQYQRECPLVAFDIQTRLYRSSRFTLNVLDQIADFSKRGMCVVYTCRITSIDDVAVTESPTLCVKLFDDRFQPVEMPEEYDSEIDVVRWFDSVMIAENYIMNEHVAYTKLASVQGSVVPWYYGAHEVTLPDGMKLYGILMEYVESYPLGHEAIKASSKDEQITAIQSARHAARILDLADINQHDWHSKQLILTRSPATCTGKYRYYAVLVDFASTTQSTDPEKYHLLENFDKRMAVLRGRRGEVGLDTRLVFDYYDDQDIWQRMTIFMPPNQHMPKGWQTVPRNPFDFMWTASSKHLESKPGPGEQLLLDALQALQGDDGPR